MPGNKSTNDMVHLSVLRDVNNPVFIPTFNFNLNNLDIKIEMHQLYGLDGYITGMKVKPGSYGFDSCQLENKSVSTKEQMFL